MGGSSKKVTVGYRYYLGMHMILCHGPADKLLEINVDGRRAWSGVGTGGRVNVQAANLFGGEKREGGVSGAVDLEMGLPTQGRNDYLESQLGSDIPAYRGVVGAVLRQCYLGLNPYLKKWAFRLSRIHKRTGGSSQWYDEKAEIKAPDKVVLPTTSSGWEYVQLPEQASPGYDYLSPPSSGWNSNGISPFGSGGWTWPGQPARNTNWSQASVLWLRRTIVVPPSAVIVARVRAENGCILWLNGSLLGEVNRDNVQLQLGDFLDFTLPAGTHTLTVKAFDEVPTLGGTYISVEIVSLSYGDMNPAHIIRECLTDPEWGMGYQEADIDDSSFTSAADKLYEEGFGISILWDRQTPIEDFVKEIVRHVNAVLYVDRPTGKFSLKLIRGDYSEGSLLTLGPDQIDKVDNFSRPAFGELVNSVTVNYWNGATGKTASTTAQDTALVQMQGAVIGTTIQYPGCTNAALAGRLASRDLQTLSNPLLSCTIYADRTASLLNIGDVFKLDWPDLLAAPVVMRVVGLAFGDGKTNKVKVTCTEDIFSLPQVGVVTPQPPVWEDPSTLPTPADVRVVVEAPYYELVQRMGQTSADELLSSSPETGYLLASARRPPGAINASLMVDAGAGYEDSGAVEFCPAAELSAPVDQLDTILPITSADSLEEIRIGSHLQLGEELVRVDAVGVNSITVGRGVLDTTPAKHPSGTLLLAWDDYAEGDQVEYLDGETLSVRLLPVSGAGEVELSAAATDTLTMQSRAARPYPPGDFRVNGSYFPSIVGPSFDIVLAWTSRNRLQQTSGELLDFFDGSVTPEAGVTYTVRVLDADNPATVVYEEDGIAGLTYTIPGGSITGAARVRLQVLSARDGLESWQAHELEFDTGVDLWTPANLTTPPTLWISDASAITEESGVVSQVNDLSANGYHLTQSSPSARPIAVAGALNGRRVLRFDGSNDRLLGPTGAAQNVLSGVEEAWSIAVVKSSTTSSGDRYYFSITESSNNNAQYLEVISSTTGGTFTNCPGVGGRRVTGTSYSETRSATAVGTNWHMALKRLKYSSATGIVNVNGGADESGAMPNMTAGVTNTVTRSHFKFGGDDNNFHNGDIAEFIFGIGTLTNDERDKLFGYLAYKWGLASELPSGHPYKANPPTN